jgi:hypothetical protein
MIGAGRQVDNQNANRSRHLNIIAFANGVDGGPDQADVGCHPAHGLTGVKTLRNSGAVHFTLPAASLHAYGALDVLH